MKKIGLVGGMTPESTMIYYRTLIELGRNRWDDPLRNPVILIYSINLAEITAQQTVGDEDGVVRSLVDALHRLRRAGAEIAALTANTPHVFFDRIAAAAGLPLVSIVEAARNRAVRLGVSKVLLLGTAATMESSMYPEALAEEGIETIVPDDAERGFVNRSIFEELAVGEVTAELRARYIELCRRRIQDDCIEAVLMACTEIPLVLRDGDLPAPLIDTARCHAEAIFERAAECPEPG